MEIAQLHVFDGLITANEIEPGHATFITRHKVDDRIIVTLLIVLVTEDTLFLFFIKV